MLVQLNTLEDSTLRHRQHHNPCAYLKEQFRTIARTWWLTGGKLSSVYLLLAELGGEMNVESLFAAVR